MNGKSKMHSRTLWFAVVIAGLSALQASMPSVREFIPPEAYGWIGLVVSMSIAVLRIITTQPLK